MPSRDGVAGTEMAGYPYLMPKGITYHIYNRCSAGFEDNFSVGNKKNRWWLTSGFLVGVPGFEPGMTGPESVVLPLHHTPMPQHFCFAVQRYALFLKYKQSFPKKIKKITFFETLCPI